MTVQRWNDEMLDELASTVTDLRESASDLRESVSDLRESVTEVKDSVDGLRITAQALLQVAAQSQSRMDHFDEEMDLLKQRQAESDQRFNVLLEEVRFLIRGNQAD
jgi:chromosome segregation ATPase